MSEETILELEPVFSASHRGNYQGAFPPKIEEMIKNRLGSPSLHLFSGSSKLGDVRVDLAHPNATIHQDVYQFIQSDGRDWAWVVLDPDYAIQRASIKLSGHARYDSVAGNVLAWRLIEDFLKLHADNVFWFDQCSPCPPGFERSKTWLFIPGAYKSVRALTWLKRKGERLA
jgi:hypothetical protein